MVWDLEFIIKNLPLLDIKEWWQQSHTVMKVSGSNAKLLIWLNFELFAQFIGLYKKPSKSLFNFWIFTIYFWQSVSWPFTCFHDMLHLSWKWIRYAIPKILVVIKRKYKKDILVSIVPFQYYFKWTVYNWLFKKILT